MSLIKFIQFSSLISLLVLGPFIPALAQNSCLQAEKLIQLDGEFEQAQLDFDLDFFKNTLAGNFIWVHNHASLIDDKAAVLKRAEKPNDATRSRISRDVKAIVLGKTAIVTGITVVDRGSSPVTYHFMRTYVEVDGKCLLLANHTMAIPDEEIKE
jgi:hypothetical protein